MIQRSRIQREILTALWEHAEHIPVTNIWPDVDIDGDVRSGFPGVPDVVRTLRQLFPEEMLRECRALLAQGDGSFTLSPRLLRENGPFIALRSSASSTAFDLLTSGGLAIGDELSAETVVYDYRFLEMLRASGGFLLAVGSMDDVVTARQLGLAAVPWQQGLVERNVSRLLDLERVTGGGRRRLLETESTEEDARVTGVEAEASSAPLGSEGSAQPEAAEVSSVGATDSLAPQPEDSASCDARVEPRQGIDFEEASSNDPPAVELIIAAWSFGRRAAISLEQIHPIVTILAETQEFLGYDYSGVAVWIPEEREVERIEYCWRLEDPNAVRQAIVDSVMKSSCAISSRTGHEIGPRQAPQDIVEARAALLLALEKHGKGSDEGRRARNEYLSPLERGFIEPLVREGLSAPSPAQRGLFIQYAEEIRLVLSLAPSLEHDLMRVFYERGAEGDRESVIAGMRVFLQLLNRASRDGRELCK